MSELNRARARFYTVITWILFGLAVVVALVVLYFTLKSVVGFILAFSAWGLVTLLSLLYLFSFLSLKRTYSKEELAMTWRQYYMKYLKLDFTAVEYKEKTQEELAAIFKDKFHTKKAVGFYLTVAVAASLTYFALNSRFQMFPVNILGFIATAWVSFNLLRGLYREYDRFENKLDEKPKNTSVLYWLLWDKPMDLLTFFYGLSLYLVLFGVIK